MIKAALFDLDGVVLDTETQYSVFWGMIGKEYHPELPDFALRIKGQTLVQIYDKYFSDDAVFAHVADYQGVEAEQARITRRLDEFELHMKYDYIVGFEAFVADLREHGVKCAVVTSSNMAKMRSVYEQHQSWSLTSIVCLPARTLPAASPIPTVTSRVLPALVRSQRSV